MPLRLHPLLGVLKGSAALLLALRGANSPSAAKAQVYGFESYAKP